MPEIHAKRREKNLVELEGALKAETAPKTRVFLVVGRHGTTERNLPPHDDTA